LLCQGSIDRTPFLIQTFKIVVTLNKIYKMKDTSHHDERIAEMKFFSVYPHYITKVEKKGRTKAELHEVIEWLTGYDEKKLNELIEGKVTFKTFFSEANLNLNVHLIKGVICGYRVEEIENSLTQQVRYLDKLVDELAKGKKIENILRKAPKK
jgi:hypothetical protein